MSQTTTTAATYDPSELLTLEAAAALIPGGSVTKSAVWTWTKKGVRCRNGERVKLEHVRGGLRLYTTSRWIAEFMKRCAENDAQADQTIQFAGQAVQRFVRNATAYAGGAK